MFTAQPLQLDVAESVVVLAVSPGSQHTVLASALDNVGNRQPIMDLNNMVVVDVPFYERFCSNNCSLRGNCSTFGICVCDPGYFGNDCSLGEFVTR